MAYDIKWCIPIGSVLTRVPVARKTAFVIAADTPTATERAGGWIVVVDEPHVDLADVGVAEHVRGDDRQHLQPAGCR